MSARGESQGLRLSSLGEPLGCPCSSSPECEGAARATLSGSARFDGGVDRSRFGSLSMRGSAVGVSVWVDAAFAGDAWIVSLSYDST